MKKIFALVLLLPGLVLGQGIGFTVSSSEFVLNKSHVQDAALRIGEHKEYLLSIELNEAGQKEFEKFLKANANKEKNQLNIIFKNEIVLSIPVHETSFHNFSIVVSDQSQAIKMLEVLSE